jgi:hypothetical protein
MALPFKTAFRLYKEGIEQTHQGSDRRPLFLPYSWPSQAASHVRFRFNISPFSSLTYSRHIVQGHIQKRADAAADHINFLLEEEQEPFTMNEYCFMEYRSNFLGYYKGIHQKSRSKFIENIQSDDAIFKVAVNKVISGLASLDLRPVDISLLPRLLPTDAMEPAIEIMAEVRAYFQGSCRLSSCLGAHD